MELLVCGGRRRGVRGSEQFLDCGKVKEQLVLGGVLCVGSVF
jgi:hypothetical protein